MKRYIDSNKFIDLYRLTYAFDDTKLFRLLDSLPPEDVKPVIHAHPVIVRTGFEKAMYSHFAVCSNCGKPIDTFDNYCRHCSAILDEETDFNGIIDENLADYLSNLSRK